VKTTIRNLGHGTVDAHDCSNGTARSHSSLESKEIPEVAYRTVIEDMVIPHEEGLEEFAVAPSRDAPLVGADHLVYGPAFPPEGTGDHSYEVEMSQDKHPPSRHRMVGTLCDRHSEA
jgi:hypothetical protein